MLPIDTSMLRYDRTDSDTYEATDLNRVGAFIELVVEKAKKAIDDIALMREEYEVLDGPFFHVDFSIPQVDAKTDFKKTDTYTLTDMNQYLNNVKKTVTAFPPKDKKRLPDSMRFLASEGANNIEENLKGSAENIVEKANKTENYIKGTAASYQYSGEIYAGGII